jgi:phage baseplate assembly protein W
MNGGQLYGRSMSFPPRIGEDGRVAWSEGETNVREAIQIILKTEEKERINLPGFGAGLQRLLFEPNTVTTQTVIKDRITKSLQLWEPRISISQVDVRRDPSDPEAAIANIEYRLVSTHIEQNVNVRIRLRS